MKYLDEQIQTTVNFSTISINEAGLYRYDLIDDIADDPLFVGNCYIEKGAKSRTIDITDLCRSILRWNTNTNFQQGFIVRIWNKEQTEFNTSQQVTVLPIYRYPNRQSRLETPLQETEQDWYIPSLQGYNSDKEAELLPHIPFISTEQASYDLLVNYGTLQQPTKDALKLYTGVEKDLNINNNSLTHTSYTLKDLFTGSKEVETIVWDWDSIINNSAFDQMPNNGIGFDTLAPLVYNIYLYRQPVQISYAENGSDYEFDKISSFPYIKDMSGNIDTEVSHYLDVFIDGDEDENSYLNVYPNVTTNCKIKAHLEITYAPENLIRLVESVSAGEIETECVYLADAVPGDTFRVTLGRNIHSAPVVDKEWTGITLNDTVEFDDTGNYQWIKVYDSSNTLLSIINLNPDLTTASESREYAFTFEQYQNGLGVFPLKQVYNVNLEFRNYIKEKSVDTNSIVISKPKVSTPSEALSDSKYSVNVVAGNTDVHYTSGGYQARNNDLIYDNRIYGGSGYLLKPNGEVYYFLPGLNITIPLTQIDKMYCAYCFEPEEGVQKLFIIETKINEEWYYNKMAFTYTTPSGLVAFYHTRLAGTKSTIYDTLDCASIDYCPSRYYLQWRDRFGSMQMQPFSKIDTYSEGFSTTETKDYHNNRKISNVSIQPKWKLNTGWLNDKVYPYYESIFVSPYLTLYDTTEDKSYPVIVTNTDYTEKTFTNQSKQLFNLQLDVELNNTQNILY